MRIEVPRNVRMAAAGLAIVGGLGLVGDGVVRSIKDGNFQRLDKRAEALVPDYNDQQFQTAKQTIVDFKRSQDALILSGSNDIPVPQEVKQAENFIKDQQVPHTKFEDIVTSESNKITVWGVGKVLAGGVMAILAFTKLTARTEPKTKRDTANLAKT